MQGSGLGGGDCEIMAVGEVASEAWEAQGVVLVVMDLTMGVSNAALQWAMDNVVHKGDMLRLVGVLTHVLNPSKSRTAKYELVLTHL